MTAMSPVPGTWAGLHLVGSLQLPTAAPLQVTVSNTSRSSSDSIRGQKDSRPAPARRCREAESFREDFRLRQSEKNIGRTPLCGKTSAQASLRGGPLPVLHGREG